MQPHRPSSAAKKIVFPLALGAFALVAVHAGAQQASPPPGPAPSASDAAKPGGTDGATGDNRERRDRPRFSAEDRMAFFNARLASIRAGLMLTPDQDKMWPQVEATVRDLIKLRAERQAQRDAQERSTDQPAGPLERLRGYGEAEAKRGEAIKKFAEAAQPLYASLNDDQKRRLRFLGRGFASMGMMGGMEQRDRGGDGWRGEHRRWRDNDQGRSYRDRRDDDDRYQRRGYDDRGGRRYDRDERGNNDRRDEQRGRWREGMRGDNGGFDRGNGIEDWRDRF